MSQAFFPRAWAAAFLTAGWLNISPLSAAWVWVEGEAAQETSARAHSWYSGQVKKDQLSGGAFLSHFAPEGPVRASYVFEAPVAGRYKLWMRVNPAQAKYTFVLNGGVAQELVTAGQAQDEVNLAADDKPDLRFLAWISAGEVELRTGRNTLNFTLEGKAGRDFHGSLDCFVLTQEPFTPMGAVKPDEVTARIQAIAEKNPGWTVWNPPSDPHTASAIDLRRLNEPVAGATGRVRVKSGRFVLGDGQPVRFWGVNGPPNGLHGEALRHAARALAKRGVNLVRIHQAVFDAKTGALRPEKVARLHEVVAAFKQEGIYAHLSIYFPLWMTPESELDYLQGYDGAKHPFAALLFNRDFQRQYQGWWKAVLTTPPEGGGLPLAQEPAVMGVELQNEDSFFFWTFSEANVPEPQRRLLQRTFGAWAIEKYGSIEATWQAWKGLKLPEDHAAEGRLAFRPLDRLATERTPRDQDTATFLVETQRRFYEEQSAFLRSLGYQGLITASNWHTADPSILDPLERFSYTAGDFIDRHGYWVGVHRGDNASWSIREGHVYSDRSALRFDPRSLGGERELSHPVFDLKYQGFPSMISETTFNRPSRFRTEGPIFYAAYGALQGTDSIVHFAYDGAGWSVKPGFFMQPWSLMTPTQIGQFPATALIYRQGLLAEGKLMADLRLPLEDIQALKGSPLAASTNLDELRRMEAPAEASSISVGSLSPLIHLVGRTQARFASGSHTIESFAPYHDAAQQTVTSSTGELLLNYSKGVLFLRGEKAQGVVGNLQAAGQVELPGLRVESTLDLGAVLLVPLDEQPLAQSTRLLLQVMTEEKPTDFTTEPAGEGLHKITRLGSDPWLIRAPQGKVQVTLPQAESLSIQPLDANGYPIGEKLSPGELTLRADVVYYLLER